MRNDELLKLILRELEQEIGPDQRGEYVCWCPFHPDGQGKPPHKPNFNVSVRGYCCHACGEKGSLKQLAKRLGLDTGPEERIPEAVYPYMDKHGNLLFEVCRYPGKNFRQRQPDGAGGSIWRVTGVQRVLYRLPELLENSGKIVFIVEGERDVESLRKQGMIATTNPGGAGKWRPEYSQSLTGRDVIILPDNDDPGRKHAQEVARSLKGIARSVKIVNLPGLPEKGDVSDWLNAGNGIEKMAELVEATDFEGGKKDEEFDEEDREHTVQNEDIEGHPYSSGMALPERLVVQALSEGVELFVDQFGCGCARFPVKSHWEVWPCCSQHFQRWLSSLAWIGWKKTVGSTAQKACVGTLEGIAQFEGTQRSLFNRVASHEGAIYYDLTNACWSAVRVTPAGWEIVPEAPILFRRFTHQSPQVDPATEGDLHAILDLVNLASDDDRLLFLVYLVTCFLPDIPHAIGVVYGAPGSGKTTFQRIVRAVVDPSVVPTLTLPHHRAELSQILYHQWCPCFDNITAFPDEISDTLCRAVTGEGTSKRKLFTDDDDFFYTYQRVTCLNGVNVVARKSDLLDRALTFFLAIIPDEMRVTDEEIRERLLMTLPRILGGVFNTLSRAMAIRPSIHVETLPRMADFALWGCAIAEALGYKKEEFLSAYNRDALVRNEEALEASPVGSMIRDMMAGSISRWEGSATELLVALEDFAPNCRVDVRGRSWPKSPTALSRKLNEVRPDLLRIGIQISNERSEGRRTITIEKEDLRGSVSTEKGCSKAT